MNEPNHMRRIAIAWFVLSAILTPIVVAVIAPDLPPGNATSAASGQVFDDTVLFGIVTPIAVAIAVYFAYTLFVFRRQPGDAAEEGEATRDNPGVHVPWLVVTIVIVLFLAGFGTFELSDAGAGGGQGPSPAFEPSGDVLPVQVIGQQWEFTYRYPTYGGVETPHLELPVGKQVALHVTSLDVIHSFWAPRLGIKADANPGVDNVVYVKPEEELSFDLRCSEVCGLWHGYMFDTGEVVSESAFEAWVEEQRKIFVPATKVLPPYATHYFPEPERRGG